MLETLDTFFGGRNSYPWTWWSCGGHHIRDPFKMTFNDDRFFMTTRPTNDESVGQLFFFFCKGMELMERAISNPLNEHFVHC